MKEGGIKKGMGCFTIPFALIVLPIALFLVILPFLGLLAHFTQMYRFYNFGCFPCRCVFFGNLLHIFEIRTDNKH